MFFMIAGPIILTLDSFVDIYWFILHMYKMDLDKVAEKKKDNSSNSVSVINRDTFKKILRYFEK